MITVIRPMWASMYDAEEGGAENAVDWSAVGLWAAAAVGGLVLLFLYLQYRGQADQPTAQTHRFGLARIGTHLALAAAGLALWIVYAITDTDWSGWAALGLLVLAIGVGASMLLTKERQRVAILRAVSTPGQGAGLSLPPEQHLPMWLHAGHGMLAIATLVLVLLNRAGAFG